MAKDNIIIINGHEYSSAQLTPEGIRYKDFSILNVEQPAKGVKHDQEKPDMSLLSSIAVTKIAEVMTYGKNKYAAHNWRNGLAFSRLLAAAFRHLFSYLGGEDKDPESGHSHLAHAACCICMLLEFETTRKDLDDRFKPTNKERV